MEFFKRNKGKKRTRADPVAIWLSGNDDVIPSGYVPLSQNEEVQRCVFLIADLVSDMTIMLMQNGENGDIRLRNELSKKIDVYPNNYMTRKTFIHKIVSDLCYTGNSVVIPEFEDTFVSNLRPTNPYALSFRCTESGYSITYNGKMLNPDEVLHFVLNPKTDEWYRGIGYTQMLKQTVQNLAQANATKKSFLRSKWKPSLIITVNTDAEEMADKEKRRKIIDSYTDTTEAGEPWLIPAGEIDVKTVQPLTLNDLAIQDSITLDIKCIARAMGIPPFLLGVGDFNKEEYNNFINTIIMSFATIIQQETTKKVLVSPNMYFKFNPKSLLQYALSEKVQFVKEMVGGGMLSRNEGRCEFDYSPVDVDGMNDYTVLENYLHVADLDKQKKLLKEGEEKDE